IHMNRYEKIEATFEAALTQVKQLVKGKASPKEVRASLREVLATTPLFKETKLRQEIQKRWDALSQDQGLDNRLDQLRQERLDLLAKQDQYEAGRKPAPPDLKERLRIVTLEIGLGMVESRIR